MTAQELVNQGHSVRDARNILFGMGHHNNLEQGKVVIRRWQGEKKKGGVIVSSGVRYL
jgi:hypothetical protein